MSNKTQLQTNNTTLDGYIARINTAKEIAATLPDAGGGSGANYETSVVTINAAVQCKYLGTDFQSKDEITSTFETIKNSMICITGRIAANSGCTIIGAIGNNQNNILLQATESTVNITVAAGGGGAD